MDHPLVQCREYFTPCAGLRGSLFGFWVHTSPARAHLLLFFPFTHSKRRQVRKSGTSGKNLHKLPGSGAGFGGKSLTVFQRARSFSPPRACGDLPLHQRIVQSPREQINPTCAGARQTPVSQIRSASTCQFPNPGYSDLSSVQSPNQQSAIITDCQRSGVAAGGGRSSGEEERSVQGGGRRNRLAPRNIPKAPPLKDGAQGVNHSASAR